MSFKVKDWSLIVSALDNAPELAVRVRALAGVTVLWSYSASIYPPVPEAVDGDEGKSKLRAGKKWAKNLERRRRAPGVRQGNQLYECYHLIAQKKIHCEIGEQ